MRRESLPSYSLPEKLTLSEEEARKWYDNALHHRGADLRYWSPYIYNLELDKEVKK
jgi:hypothetical protein